MEVGGEGDYIPLNCHHQNDFCIKMGSDESHFNVSVGSDGQSHKTVQPRLSFVFLPNWYLTHAHLMLPP